MSEKDVEILLARLDEKYNNLKSLYLDLKERNQCIQEDLIKKQEELKELNYIDKTILSDIETTNKNFNKVLTEFAELKELISEEMESLQELKNDKFFVYSKIFIAAVISLAGVIGAVFAFLIDWVDIKKP